MDMPSSGKDVASSMINGHAHRLHNRPAKAPIVESKPNEDLPSATALLSFMLVALECPVCHDTFSNPTTLACGHTVCQGCMTAPHALPTKPLIPSTPPPALTRSESVSSSGSRRRSPVMAASALLPDWLGLRRRGSTASEASQTDAPPTAGIFGRGISTTWSHVAPNRPECPHPECRELAYAGPTPHPDIVLQNLTARFVVKAPHKAPLRDRMRRLKTTDGAGEGNVLAPASPPRRRISSGSGEAMDESGSGRGSGSSTSNELTADGKRMKKPPRISAKRVRLPEEAVIEDDEAGAEGDIEEDASAPDPPSPDLLPTPSFAEVCLEELECQVCTSIFVEPITTPCGHSFCRRCLVRSLDHSDKCPLCRSDMPSYSFFAHHAHNSVITSFLEHANAFQAISLQRKALLVIEDHLDSPHVPVFVCSLSWPGLPTFLHVFEPRYRLMMRRAMETDRRFGMCLPGMPGRPAGCYEYGTMLEIQKLDMLPDGRSVIETLGLFRFRVLERSTLDGYNTAMVERIEDITAEQETQLERTDLERLATEEPLVGGTAEEQMKWSISRKSTTELMADCRAFYQTLKDGHVSSWQYQRVNNTYGPLPDNPAEASFWFAQVLPIDDYQKAQLLPVSLPSLLFLRCSERLTVAQVTSPRLRLQLVVFWIESLRCVRSAPSKGSI